MVAMKREKHGHCAPHPTPLKHMKYGQQFKSVGQSVRKEKKTAKKKNQYKVAQGRVI